MKYKIIISLILTILVLPLLVAQTYEANTTINFKVPFEVNGSIASSSATCNISITDPNSNFIKQNHSMTNLNAGDFNITLFSNQTGFLGEYDWTAFCCDGVFCAGGVGIFTVTRTGNQISTGEAIVYLIFLFAIMFAFGLSLFGAIKIPYNNPRGEQGDIISINDLKYVKVFLIVLSYLLLMFIFGVTRAITANYLFLNGAHKVFNFLFMLMFYFTWPIIVCSIIFTFILFINGKKMKHILSRGVPLR